jgi:hypothetical protein
MDQIMAFRQTITRWRQRFAAFIAPKADTPPNYPGVIVESDGARINDGVDYSQPVVMPEFVRRQLAAEGKLTESLAVSDQAQSYRSQFGMPYRSNPDDFPFVPTTEDPLLEWDWQTRERVLSNCHAAYNRNPLANAAVNFTTDFVIGTGFNLTFKNPEVERVLKAFMDNPENAIRKYERQAVNDLQVDGELIVGFEGKGEDLIMYPLRPWELQWIKTDKGFFRRPEVYHFERYLREGDDPSGGQETVSEDIPADKIHFVAINDHAYELRGRPELYRILPWLKADKEWLENRAMQNKWRNALLWWVSIANATAPAIANVVARWRKPPSPGSAYVSSANETVTALSNPVGGADAGHDGRAIRLMVILGLRLPEYFFGDGSMTNLATATRQELPALTKFESFQQILIEQLWIPVFKRVLEGAGLPDELDEYDSDGKLVYEPQEDDEEADALPAEPMPTIPQLQKQAMNGATPKPMMSPPKVKKTLPLCDCFEVTYKPVATQDLTALANMLNIATEKGWASNQTAAEKLGFDPVIEKNRVQSEEQENLAAIAQGRKAMPPEMMPPDTGEDEEVPNGKQPAANG